MKITKELIISKGAKCEQVDLFARTFPRGATITKTSLAKAFKAKLDLVWAIENLMPRQVYATYRAQRKLLDKAYLVRCKPLDDAYRSQRKALDEAPLDNTYRAKHISLDDAYGAQRDKVYYVYFARLNKLAVKILLKYRNG